MVAVRTAANFAVTERNPLESYEIRYFCRLASVISSPSASQHENCRKIAR
jgi:hypothetical protein